MNEVQFCLEIALRIGGFSACPMFLGQFPVDLDVWQDGGSDLDLVQDTSISVQQWNLRSMAQEATSEGVPPSKLRRSPAHNKTFECSDVEAGDFSIFY